MKLKLQLALGLLAFTTHSLVAQVSAYNFSQSMSNYSTALTGTFIGHNFQDDTVNNVTLPFPFDFNGSTYNAVNLSSNGFISFNALTGTEYNPISDANTQNVISAFGQDLVSGIFIHVNLTMGSNTVTGASMVAGISVGDSILDYNNHFGSPYPKIVNIIGNTIILSSNALVTSSGYDLFINNGAIRMQMAGNTPTRVCEFEYQNFSRFGTFDEFITFKIRLHELNDRITIMYGSATPGDSISTSEIGLKGSSNADFNSRTVVGNDTYITSQPAVNITDACDVSPSKMPSGGVTYIWQPDCTIPNFTVAQSSASICVGDSSMLTASPASNYSWTGVGSGSQIVVSPTTSTVYTLIAHAQGCTSTVNVLQTVSPFPTVTVAQSTNNICAGESATLTASGAMSYSWINEGAGDEITVTPAATSVYTVIGSNNGCTGEFTVTQNVTPVPELIVTQSHSVGCFGTLVQLTASGATTYSWNTGGTAAALNVVLTETTTYTVTGFNGSCSSQSIVTQEMKNCSGLPENAGAFFTVYPNPFNNAISIKNESGKKLLITVTDVSGKHIFRSNTDVTGEFELNTSAWSNGFYFLTVNDGIRITTRKIIKN